MSYRCIKPQCGREVHRDDYRAKLRCYCGAPVETDSKVSLKLLRNGVEQLRQSFELPHVIKVGRGRRFLFEGPDLDLSPYLTKRGSVSRKHLSLYITDEKARVSLDSSKRGLVVNRVAMNPGCQPDEFQLPLDIQISSELSLLVELC